MPDERSDEPTPGGWLPPTGGDEPITPAGPKPAQPDGWLPPSDAPYTPPAPEPPQPSGASSWPGQPAPPVQYGGTGDVAGLRQNHGKATASLALSVVGLFLCPVVFSVAAIVLGKQAQGDMDAQPNRYDNRGQANWGVNLGWVGFVLGLLVIVLAIAGVPILPE